jgi:hypothetical protein
LGSFGASQASVANRAFFALFTLDALLPLDALDALFALSASRTFLTCGASVPLLALGGHGLPIGCVGDENARGGILNGDIGGTIIRHHVEACVGVGAVVNAIWGQANPTNVDSCHVIIPLNYSSSGMVTVM